MTEQKDARAAALERLRYEMELPPFHAVLKPQALDADPDKGVVVIGLAFNEALRRLPDERSYHGGVIAALIDLAGHASVAVKTGRMAPTIDLRIDYLRPAEGSGLTATATLIKAGRSVARTDIAITDDKGRQIAIGRGTYSTGGG